jgi:selenide,water dikinase
MRQRVALVGAGHAHVEVLRQWAKRPPERAELVLVVDRNPAIYSGMVPGMIAGQYRACDLEIDGIALARRAGGRVVHEPAVGVSRSQRIISTASGASIEYDWASLDVGSTVVGRELPGVADHALAARPIQSLIAGVSDLIARARVLPEHEPLRVSIVGAGAGGVELALCFEARLRRDVGRAVSVALLDRGEAPLPGAPAALVRRLSRVLARRGVRFRGGVEVTTLEGPNARLADGTTVEAEAVIWVPGPAAHAFLGNGDLPLDPHGFVRIGPTLQVEGSERLFAVGDCASLPGMQKAGVEGRWVMRLKDWIDRRFMERYR